MLIRLNNELIKPAAFTLLLLLLLFSCKRNKEDVASEVNYIPRLIEKAWLTSVNGNCVGPINFLDSALEGRDLSVTEKIQVMSYKAAILNSQLQDYDNATRLVDSLLAMIETAGINSYKTDYALANYSKGDILFNQKLYDQAYTYYYKARSIGKINLDSCTLAEYTFRLGLILYRQSRFQEAAEIFQRSYEQSQTCKQDFFQYYRLQQVLDNVGLSYYKSGKFDSALLFYQKALQFINTNGSKYKDREALNDVALAVIYGNMADIHRLKGDSLTAKQLLKKSISINTRKGNDNRDAQFSQVKLAEIYYNEKSTDSLLIILNELRRGLDTVANVRAEMDWNRLMWGYWDGKNNVVAYDHLQKFNSLRDSLERESNQLKSADLTQQIRTMESQYQIQALQKDNEIKNIYLWLAVILSILAVIIVFYIFRSLVKSKRNIELLRSLNERVNEQKLQLQKTFDTVEEKNKQQERILRAVAHDLRAPVATISMLTDLVEQEQNEASRKEMINFIRTSCNNSLELIAEILEAADQSNRKEQGKEFVRINQVIKNSADLLQLKASEKHQKINYDLPKQELFVMVNAEKIKRVISNLVNNSIKFSPKEAAININIARDEEHVIISVSDNGIGIPGELQSSVFDMFTEAKRKGTAGELPYGLGLSICKQIVEAHNGSIWLTSNPGEGTTFFVKLPI